MYVFRQFPLDAVINEGIQSTYDGNAYARIAFHKYNLQYNIYAFVHTPDKNKSYNVVYLW